MNAVESMAAVESELEEGLEATAREPGALGWARVEVVPRGPSLRSSSSSFSPRVEQQRQGNAKRKATTASQGSIDPRPLDLPSLHPQFPQWRSPPLRRRRFIPTLVSSLLAKVTAKSSLFPTPLDPPRTRESCPNTPDHSFHPSHPPHRVPNPDPPRRSTNIQRRQLTTHEEPLLRRRADDRTRDVQVDRTGFGADGGRAEWRLGLAELWMRRGLRGMISGDGGREGRRYTGAERTVRGEHRCG